jgi:hypothetical protein
MLAVAQEKTTSRAPDSAGGFCAATAPLSECGSAHPYDPADVKVLGDLDYGQTSESVDYSSKPPFRAFVFSAFGGERVEVTVKGDDRKAFVALTDSTLNQLMSGSTNLSLSLPYRGPYIEVWYILFRDFDSKPGRFTVQVKKLANTPEQSQADGSTASTKH